MELNDTAEKITAKDVNLSDSSFEDADLSRVQFHDSTLQGATFRDVDLRGATFTDASLEEVKIVDCNLEGMTIEGIAVSTLLEVYESTAEYDEDEEDGEYVEE